MIRVAYFGTDKYAADLLSLIHQSELFEVAVVVTQPDKPVGRKKVLTPPPVAIRAAELGVAIDQPHKLRKEDKDYSDVDVGITTRYGQIIPDHVLHGPTHGVVNIHPSLLPAYRGATPIQQALIDGVTETGVTLMKMDAGLDTGPILGQTPYAVQPDDTYETVSEALLHPSFELLISLLPKYVSGELVPTPQDDSLATHCSQLSKDDGKIDWTNNLHSIYNQYRGLTPWPGIWTTHTGSRIKLLAVAPSETAVPEGQISLKHGTLLIGTATTALRILSIQLEGKQPLTEQQFLAGYKSFDGAVLGT